ncbi:hypothetical protein [Gemmobacter sp. 24YEA27]|uniref:hypothetical protein n=1 Tax=Gemmobacter sp. 24YEA27 TaxID=3040672 RepID=UPI0024B36B66|nr:hypothetical protein [Gemmobacter sp. 24YEA27]
MNPDPKKGKAAAYFRPNKTQIHAPTLHFLDLKPLSDLIVTALSKELERRSKIKRGKKLAPAKVTITREGRDAAP